MLEVVVMFLVTLAANILSALLIDAIHEKKSNKK